MKIRHIEVDTIVNHVSTRNSITVIVAGTSKKRRAAKNSTTANISAVAVGAPLITRSVRSVVTMPIELTYSVDRLALSVGLFVEQLKGNAKSSDSLNTRCWE